MEALQQPKAVATLLALCRSASLSVAACYPHLALLLPLPCQLPQRAERQQLSSASSAPFPGPSLARASPLRSCRHLCAGSCRLGPSAAPAVPSSTLPFKVGWLEGWLACPCCALAPYLHSSRPAFGPASNSAVKQNQNIKKSHKGRAPAAQQR